MTTKNAGVSVTVMSGGRGITAKDVYAKPPTPMSVPLRELEGAENLALGLRVEMFVLEDDDGNGGQVTTGAGCGSDAIILQWGPKGDKRNAVVRGLDLLRAWVASFDPEEAARFPDG